MLLQVTAAGAVDREFVNIEGPEEAQGGPGRAQGGPKECPGSSREEPREVQGGQGGLREAHGGKNPR